MLNLKNYKIIDEKQKIDELFNKLKGLLTNYPNNRVDFEFDKHDRWYWDGEEYDRSEFEIYYGSSWYCDDELLVKSIYVEADELYFDCTWTAWNYKGNKCDCKEFDYILADLLYSRSQDIKTLIEASEFFIDILK